LIEPADLHFKPEGRPMPQSALNTNLAAMGNDNLMHRTATSLP
jgi:hypothetical protein